MTTRDYIPTVAAMMIAAHLRACLRLAGMFAWLTFAFAFAHAVGGTWPFRYWPN